MNCLVHKGTSTVELQGTVPVVFIIIIASPPGNIYCCKGYSSEPSFIDRRFEQSDRLIISVIKNTRVPLLDEFYAKLQYQQLKPKNIVEYKREAYIYKAGNVRVTIDSDLRSTSNISDFLNEKIITVPIADVIILEVKYDNYLPELIKNITALNSRQAVAFSKYAAARQI